MPTYFLTTKSAKDIFGQLRTPKAILEIYDPWPRFPGNPGLPKADPSQPIFALLCLAWLGVVLRCFALRCFALLCIALDCFALLCVALLCITLLGVALRCVACICSALLCFALLCVALL